PRATPFPYRTLFRSVVLDGELAGKDDAFGLVPDVEENLVMVDLDDRPLDDVTVVEVLDGRVDGCEELVFRADVVDRDLRDIRRRSEEHTSELQSRFD